MSPLLPDKPEQLSFDDALAGFSGEGGRVLHGSCGWADQRLINCGRFYPERADTPAKRLGYYAEHFPLVEVDSSHYAPVEEVNAWRWVERTPRHFTFDLKAYALLTRHRAALGSLPYEVRRLLPASTLRQKSLTWSQLPPAAREWVWIRHLEALRPLAAADKLGVVLFQFPPWFQAGTKARGWLKEVAHRLPYRMAVEFRGGGWMDRGERASTLRLLERLGLSYVIVDEPLGFASSTPPVVARTGEISVIRLHGRNEQTWEKRVKTAAERFRYLYSEDELAPWVDTALLLARDGGEVHVLLNNCFEDQAVTNALQFGALLAEKRAAPGRRRATQEQHAPPG